MVIFLRTEEEYVGSLAAAREGIWLRHILNNFIDSRSRNIVTQMLEISRNISRTDLP
jgi:hypothetical protein